jgi:4-hydroxy-2-oxoheptanedioate aldolase
MNPLKARWAAGETTFGVWGTIDSSFTAELLAGEGPDFFCCDQQHGVIDYQLMVAMFQGVRASGSVPISRVPNHDVMLIGKTLDAGALAVIVPMVSTPKEAAQLVSACRYQPAGVRSYGPIRAGMALGSTQPEPLSDVACVLMIETASALGHVDAIAATPGVDALYIGPADLCLSLGLPPTFDRPEAEYRDSLAAVLAACERHGVVPGIQCTSGDMARRYEEMGFRLITVASDANTLRSAVRAQLDAARGLERTVVTGGYA